jgi:cytochrome d ubiquinol oxidase subunit I
MVALGAHLSAVWIVVANSWMQTPAGFHIVGEGLNARAEIVDFWAMVFNPSSIERLTHTLGGAWLTGAFLVISISAYYLLKNKHIEFSLKSLKIGFIIALVASLFQLITGHSSAKQVYEYQPAKLAAFEGHYETTKGDLYLIGWVDEKNQNTVGIKIPGLLSYLLFNDFEKPVTGLNEFKKEDRPPVNIVFQTYHFMVGIGFLLILLSILGLYLTLKNKIADNKTFLFVSVFSVILPHIANQLGWMSAEIGRQPWIVYNLLRTKDALSKSVDSSEVMFSLILFTLIYILLFILFIYLLDKKIKSGPDNLKASYDVYTEKPNIIKS